MIKKAKSYISSLVFLLKPAWRHGRGVMITSILFNLICEPLYTILFVNFIRVIVDAFTAQKELKEILLLAFVFQFIIMLVLLVRHAMNTLYQSKKYPQFFAALEKEVYKKNSQVDYKYVDDEDYYNKYTWVLQNYSSQIDDAVIFLENFCKSAAVIVALCTSIASNDFFVIIISVVTLILSNIFANKQKKVNHEISLKYSECERGQMYVERAYYLRDNASDMRCSTLPQKLGAMYDKAINKQLKIVDETKWKQFRYQTAQELLSFALQLCIIFYLCFRIFSGKISIGSFAGLIYAADALKQNISSLLGLQTKLNEFDMFVETAKKFFNIPSKIENAGGEPADFSSPLSLQIHNVSFKYNNSGFSLNNINMNINPGEKIAIVGFNGAGKSTLIKLLMRLYDVDEGCIEVNGKDIREYDVHSFRKNVGIAFQNNNIYAMSLKDNMLLYSAEDENLESALAEFDLDKVLHKANADIDTPLTKEFDENGIVLSGGEQQKLALARVFLGKYNLLILDEPSSALDPISEYQLNQKIFKMSNTTTVLISHRLTSARHADRIYLFDNGSIIESGTHDELMLKKGVYYDMFTKQAESYQL